MDSKEINTVLIYRCGTIGDTIVSIPVIRIILNHFKNASFFLMTAHDRDAKIWADGILSEFGWFDGFITYTASDLTSLKGIVKLINKIRAVEPDVVFYMASDKNSGFKIWRDRIFFIISGAKRFIPFYSSKITYWGRLKKEDRVYPRETLRFIERLKDVGIDSDEVRFDLPIKAEHVEGVNRFIAGTRCADSRLLIGMCPWSKQPVKRWPLDRFAELGRRLIEELDAHIVIVGGREEDDISQTISKNWPDGCWRVSAGRLSILETAELLRRCAFYVGNDTGAMHMAAAVGTPCVAIFSAKDPPESWHPYGEGHVVIRKKVSCRNCYLMECREHRMKCLLEISVGDVWKNCKEVIVRKSDKSEGLVYR